MCFTSHTQKKKFHNSIAKFIFHPIAFIFSSNNFKTKISSSSICFYFLNFSIHMEGASHEVDKNVETNNVVVSNVVSGTRWITKEDVQFCKSWKFVSQCPITGVNRKKTYLWSEVLKHYNENGFYRMSTQSLIRRCKLLNGEMYAWCCALRQVREWQCSGSNPLNEVCVFVLVCD